MSFGKRLRRLRERPLDQWLLLGEAGTLLIAARVILRVAPTSRIVGWVRRPMQRQSPDGGTRTNLEPLRWAVTAFSRNAPIRLVCFPQALAMHAMLRRRHIASEILYGAARMDNGKLAAHAWLRSGDRVWVGGEVSPEFTVLDTWSPTGYPASPDEPN